MNPMNESFPYTYGYGNFLDQNAPSNTSNYTRDGLGQMNFTELHIWVILKKLSDVLKKDILFWIWITLKELLITLHVQQSSSNK